MADRPIIFSAPMVQSLLQGRKSQTRRVLKNGWQPILNANHDVVKTWFAPPEVPAFGIPNQWAPSGIWVEKHGATGYNRFLGLAPYRPGDRLWVREAVTWVSAWGWRYRADNDDLDEKREAGEVGRWRSSIHMPRSASRITLAVTEVRVQRLQEISEADAVAEGCDPVHMQPGGSYGNPSDGWLCYREGFARLWNSLHGPEAWDANPWVCAVSFEAHRHNIDKA